MAGMDEERRIGGGLERWKPFTDVEHRVSSLLESMIDGEFLYLLSHC